jgi:hypothetical protein
MKLINILESILFEASTDSLKKDFVDSGKVSQEIFDSIVDASNGQYGYAVWLLKRVIEKVILPEDIYKYKDYLEVFNRYKKRYPSNDITQYKTREQVREFVLKSIEIMDMKAEAPVDGDSLVSTTDMMKLKSIGINMIGIVDGYQCFKVPTELANDENAYKIYTKILGDAGGKKISICTMANFSHFQSHLQDDDFYVFFNKKDDLSPYQLGYAQKQFKDRNDTEYVYSS